MKLSELSLRDHIAIQAMVIFRRRQGSEKTIEEVAAIVAKRSYLTADAMLAEMGKRDHEIETVTARAATAERTLEILRPVWAQGHSSDSLAAQAHGTALAEIWHFLGVDNQTAAMQKLRDLLHGGTLS